MSKILWDKKNKEHFKWFLKKIYNWANDTEYFDANNGFGSGPIKKRDISFHDTFVQYTQLQLAIQ